MCHVLPLYLSLSLCLSFSICTTSYLSLILFLFYVRPSFFPSLFVSFPEAMCLFLSPVHLLVSVFKLQTVPLFASLHRCFLPPQTISFCFFLTLCPCLISCLCFIIMSLFLFISMFHLFKEFTVTLCHMCQILHSQNSNKTSFKNNNFSFRLHVVRMVPLRLQLFSYMLHENQNEVR